MTVHNISEIIVEKILDTLKNTNNDVFIEFIAAINNANRIFIAGMGRSGLIGKAFGMRLIHIGKKVFIVGETTTPAIKEGDLLIAISGSGQTKTTNFVATTAKNYGAHIAAITSNPHSALSSISDTLINIKKIETIERVYYEEKKLLGHFLDIMPMGTSFELSSLVYLEAVIAKMILAERIQEVAMKANHTNLE